MSKDIKKALEHCVDWNCDNCPNRNELGSGETVCRGRLLPEVLEYVADLEAKLTESEKQGIRDFYLKRYEKKLKEYDKENKQLKQQLAESEKEKNYYQDLYFTSVKGQEKLKQQLAEKETDLSLARNEINTLKHNLNILQEHDNVMCEQYFNKCKETNQDKISFALEQLDKVREFLAKRKDDYLYLKDEIKAISYNQYVDFVNEVEIFELKVDNQIKQLKENK